MEIHAKIKYQEEYLPTKRHRIPRIREVDETITVELREIQKKDASLAMVVTDYQSYLDEAGNDQFGLMDTEFFAIEGQLFTCKRDRAGALDQGPYSLEQFIKDIEQKENQCFFYNSNTREDTLQRLQNFLDSHVLIDGQVYCRAGEPRYMINTFGLGHNHGGTGMFIQYGYNPNISHNNYFNALQRDDALAYADSVAAKRGDTRDIGTFGDKNIVVYMPEMVRCNPNLEHGIGNPFLNSMEDLIQTSGSSLEAGLLVLSQATSQISERNQSLFNLIEDASSRTQKISKCSEEKGKHKEPDLN